MEKLRTLVDTELLKSEFTRRLSTVLDDYVISDVRSSLYIEAKSKGLMEKGDQPVSRRKCATGMTVKGKHIDDIWRLMCLLFYFIFYFFFYVCVYIRACNGKLHGKLHVRQNG